MKRHRPAFQFYIGDWKKDPAVTCLSLEARGLWFEMLLHMHESRERGYLVHDSGKPITADQVARMVGSDPEVVNRCLSEMEDAGTFSRDERGAIYSRRMVRDQQISQMRSEAGKRGNVRQAEVLGFDRAKVRQNAEVCPDKTVCPVKSPANGQQNENFCPTKISKNNEEHEEPKKENEVVSFEVLLSDDLTGYDSLRREVESRVPPDTYTPSDWAKAKWLWSKLDNDQRQTAQRNWIARIESGGDSLSFLKPQTFLKDGEWKRNPSPPRGGPGGGKSPPVRNAASRIDEIRALVSYKKQAGKETAYAGFRCRQGRASHGHVSRIAA